MRYEVRESVVYTDLSFAVDKSEGISEPVRDAAGEIMYRPSYDAAGWVAAMNDWDRRNNAPTGLDRLNEIMG